MIDGRSRVIVQGITGHQGRFHAQAMRDFGTKVVAGVTPGKGGDDGRRGSRVRVGEGGCQDPRR